MLEGPVALGQADGNIDRSVIRHIEEEDLGRASGEEVQEAFVCGPLLDPFRYGLRERAEMPKRHRSDGAGKG
jgi:hypothetical protein